MLGWATANLIAPSSCLIRNFHDFIGRKGDQGRGIPPVLFVHTHTNPLSGGIKNRATGAEVFDDKIVPGLSDDSIDPASAQAGLAV